MKAAMSRALVLALLAALVGGAAAEEIFVAPDGDDANPGTLEKPLKSPVKAAARLKAGDTLFFRAGEYKCRTSATVGLAPSADGEEGRPITFRNYQNEHVKLDLTGSDWGLTNNGYSYIVFDGFEIVNRTHYGMKLSAASGRRTKDGGNVYGHHITIRNCEVHRSKGECIFSAGTEHLTIENCHLHHSDRSHGLYLQVGCHNAVVRNVTSEHNYGNSGMQLNAAGGGIKNALVERCILRYNAQGLSLMGVKNCTFRNNIIYNNGYEGPRGAGYREIILWTYGEKDKPGTVCENSLFENNTIVNLLPQGHKLNQLVEIKSGTHSITFRSNVFYVRQRPVFVIAADSEKGHVFESNCLFGAGEVKGAESLAAFAKDKGLKESGTVSKDPMFADVEKGDVSLKDGSPCLEAGKQVMPGIVHDIGAVQRQVKQEFGCNLPWKKAEAAK